MTDDTGRQMYAAICADPEDVTARLAYADYLDGLGVVRPERTCTMCIDGKQNDCEIGDLSYNEWDCEHCQGTGKITAADPDTSNTDLAEFIRVQCQIEAASSIREFKNPAGGTLFERERELQKAHPEWERCPCPECNGHGRQWVTEKDASEGGYCGPQCTVCGGIGDLLFRGDSYRNRPHDCGKNHRCVTLRFGGPYLVKCTMQEVWQEKVCDRCGGDGRRHGSDRPFEWTPDPDAWKCPKCLAVDSRVTVPTDWALAVVRHTPVARFVVTDAPIHPSGGNDTYYVGGLGNFPKEYWARLDNHPTRRAAADALAAVLAEWARTFPSTR